MNEMINDKIINWDRTFYALIFSIELFTYLPI